MPWGIRPWPRAGDASTSRAGRGTWTATRALAWVRSLGAHDFTMFAWQMGNMIGHEEEELEFELEFPAGEGDESATATHPIIAPFRVLLEEGRRPGQWVFFAVREGGESAPRLVGTFVQTVADRILFFPGGWVDVINDSGETRFGGHQVDHLTLDPGPGPSFSSHVAVRRLPLRKSRGSGYETLPPPGHKVPWFSLITPNLDDFVRLPRRIELRIPAPPVTPDEFVTSLREQGGGRGLPVVELPPRPKTGPSFVQMDAWAGRTQGWQVLKARPLAWAYKGELVRDAPVGSQDLSVQQLSIEFSSTSGLTLILVRPVGRLNGAHILRPTLSE
jgi:hypothetical protein